MQPSTMTFAPPEWFDFLRNRQARIEDCRITDFGNPPAERLAVAQGNIIADLSHLALLRAEGGDARDFLQGQLSNDIRSLDASHAQISSYSSPKGRMLTVFQLFQRGEAIYLELPAANAESILKRLRMYILRAKVKLDVESTLVRFGLSGPDSEPTLTALLGSAPAAPGEVLTAGEVTLIRLNGPYPRFEVVAPRTNAQALWAQLSRNHAPVGTGPWVWLDIQAGIPTVLPETSEAFVPQMANLDLIDGVSFNKGCYPGQEIVARMHFLGKLKQRMFRLHLDGNAVPGSGEKLYSKKFGDQAAGTIVKAEPSPNGGADLLAVIQIEVAHGGDVHLTSTDGPLLTLQPLPYPIPDAF